MNTKNCTKCQLSKDLGDYHKDAKSKDGRCSICKACACAKSRQWHLDNSEQAKVSKREYYEKNKCVFLARSKQWRESNREKRRKIVSKWSRTHKPQVNAKARRNRQQSLEHYREVGRRAASIRRQRIFVVDARPIEQDWWQAIFDIFETGLCIYCGKAAKLTMDHFVPVSRGGATVAGNLLACCRSCNSSKGNSMPDVWVKDRYGERGYQSILMFLDATKAAYDEWKAEK